MLGRCAGNTWEQWEEIPSSAEFSPGITKKPPNPVISCSHGTCRGQWGPSVQSAGVRTYLCTYVSGSRHQHLPQVAGGSGA